jgi:hypothetical protein
VAGKNVRAHPKDPAYRIGLALVQARLGKTTEMAFEGERAPMNAEGHFMLANLYGVLGNSDQALEQLELAIEKGFRNYVFMRIHPDFAGLAADPRFQSLLERVLK